MFLMLENVLIHLKDFPLQLVLNNKQHLSSSAGCFCVLVRSSGAAGTPSLDASGALDSSSGVWPETRCVHPDSSEPSDLLQGEEAWGGKWSSSVWGERDVGLTDLCLVVLLGFLQLTSQLVFTALECERKNIFSVFLIWWLFLCNKEEGTLQLRSLQWPSSTPAWLGWGFDWVILCRSPRLWI